MKVTQRTSYIESRYQEEEKEEEAEEEAEEEEEEVTYVICDPHHK
jgi:hypothetical protein